MSDLTLTGAIPGLLRRGSPVTKTWLMDNDFDSYDSVTVSGVVLEQLEDDEAGERWSCWFFDERIGRDTGFAPDLDITDPTGRFHALLWLCERGHDLRWAEDEAEVLAWSVLSVARGGGPLTGVMRQWCHSDKYGGQWTRMGGPGSVYAEVREYGRREEGWERGWYLWGVSGGPRGPETNTLGRATADRAALAAGYALRNGNNVLVLPPLPEVPHAR